MYSTHISAYNHSTRSRAQHYLQEGIRHYRSGQYQKSIVSLTHSIILDPNHSWAFYYRGNIYRKTKQYTEAINEYTKAIEKSPNMAKAYHALGDVYFLLQEPTNAIENYNIALRLDPSLDIIYKKRCISFFNVEEDLSVISDANTVLDKDPHDAILLYCRGVAYFRQNDLVQAVIDLTQTIELDPRFANAYFALGIIYDSLNLPEKAIEYYTEALKLSHEFSEAYLLRGINFLLLDNQDEAEKDLLTAWNNENNTTAIKLYAGITLQKIILFPPEEKKKFIELIQLLNVQPIKTIEEYCVLTIAAHIIKDNDLATKCFQSVLYQHSLTNIPPFLQNEWMEMMLDPLFLPHNLVTQNIKTTPDEALDFIVALQNKVLKQDAFWQALCPQTLLGHFFSSQSIHLREKITRALQKEIRLSKDTLILGPEIIQTIQDPSTNHYLRENYPELYDKLAGYDIIHYHDQYNLTLFKPPKHTTDKTPTMRCDFSISPR